MRHGHRGYALREDYAIIYPENYINDIEGERLEETCTLLFENEGVKKIVIDFSSTDIVNSIGISILVGIIEKVREKKGSISLMGLKNVNIEIFRMIGITKHVPVFTSEEEAHGWATGI